MQKFNPFHEIRSLERIIKGNNTGTKELNHNNNPVFLETVHKDVENFAKAEQLTAHANSVAVRFE